MRLRQAVLSSIVLGSFATGAIWLGGCGNNGGDPKPLPPPGGFAGSDGTAGADGIDDSQLYPPSRCNRVGGEVQLTQTADVQTVSLLWDTDHYLLAYADRATNGGEILTVRLDPAGNALGAPVPVGSSPNYSRVPTLAKLPTGGYLLAFDEGSKPASPGDENEEPYAPAQAYTVVLDANGAPTAAPVPLASSPNKETKPIVAVTPEGPIVTWMEGDYAGGNALAYVGRLDATGTLVADSKKQLGPASSGFPHVLSGPMGTGVVFSQATVTSGAINATIEFGLLDATLGLTNRQSLRAATGDARLPRLSVRGSGFIAAWEDFRDLDDEGFPYEQVFMARVDQTGAKTPDVLVENTDTGSANWPNTASTGDGSASAVVYYQYRKSRPQVFLALIDANGNKVEGDLQVSETPASGGQAKYPAVGWSPANATYGVTWIDSRSGAAQVYFAAVSCPNP